MGSQPSADLIPENGDTTLVYLRPQDRGDVLGVPVESTKYIFNDGKRLWIVGHKVAAVNAAPLLTAMKREFGEPDGTEKDGYSYWYEPKGDRKNCRLEAGYAIETSGEAGVCVMSCPLMREEGEATFAAALAATFNANGDVEVGAMVPVGIIQEKMARAGISSNKNITDVHIYKNVDKGQLLIGFRLHDMLSAGGSIKGPGDQFLVRLFDVNGTYLTHFKTERIYDIFQGRTEYALKGRPVNGAHVFQYAVAVRDLRDTAMVEFGFDRQ